MLKCPIFEEIVWGGGWGVPENPETPLDLPLTGEAISVLHSSWLPLLQKMSRYRHIVLRRTLTCVYNFKLPYFPGRYLMMPRVLYPICSLCIREQKVRRRDTTFRQCNVLEHKGSNTLIKVIGKVHLKSTHRYFLFQ